MKKSILITSLSLAALSFVSCQKEEVRSESSVSEPNFTLFAQTVDTKTSNDDLNTKWVAEDAINVFHAVKDATTYTSDGKFTVSDVETGKFAGTVSGTLSEESYDWYALYPYTAKITTPKNTSSGYVTVGGKTQKQNGNNSKAHLCGTVCPLYGIAKDVPASESPAITMNQLTSVVKVKVTNNSGDNLTVNSVVFTGTEDIAGTYYIDFVSSPVVYKSSGSTYVSSTATLTVSNGDAIENGSSAEFYIAIKPFTAASGKELKLSVNGYEKTITLTDDIDFTAGHIKTLNFSYGQKVVNYSGSYLIVDKDVTKVCPAYNSDYNNIPALDYSVPEIRKTWAMTVTKVKGVDMYTIQDANGLYLSTGSESKKNYLIGEVEADESRSRWAISENSDGTYSVVATNSSYSNRLSFNSIYNIFSCYSNSNQTAIKLIDYVDLPYLTAPSFDAKVQSLNSIYVLWQPVTGAKSYIVKCGSESITVSEDGSETYEHTFTELDYSTEYSVSIVAVPNDETAYRNSDPALQNLTTGANPAGKLEYTYTISPSDFSATGYTSTIKIVSAKATSDDSKKISVNHEKTNAGNISGKIQFKKSAGCIYNTNDLGTVTSVVLNDASGTTYTVYIGTSENPTTSGTGGYFAIKETGGKTLTCSSITVTFEK